MNDTAVNVLALVFGALFILFNKPLGEVAMQWQSMIARRQNSLLTLRIPFIALGVLCLLISVSNLWGEK